MIERPQWEMPAEKEAVHRRALRLEWLTIAYLLSAIFVLYLTLGSSQAMKAAWIEDMLSLLPPVAFLVAARFRNRVPSEGFPWGYHRVVSIAYLAAAAALLLLGAWILFDSLMSLVRAEHPSIGGVIVFGEEVWLGWLMLPALAWSALPAVLLGRAKLPLASELHDKVLYADAKMNKADWMTAVAAMAGVLGISLGLWWADAVAAAVIASDIAHDGWTNLRAAMRDLMDSRPRTYDGSKPHPLHEQLLDHLQGVPWIRHAQVRLREEGHVFSGEVLVVPADDEPLPHRVVALIQELQQLDWKLYDIAVQPVPSLPDGEAPVA